MFRVVWLIGFLVSLPALAAENLTAHPALDVLAEGFGGWDAVRSGRTFAYRLKLTNAKQVLVRDDLYRIDLVTGHVWSRNLLTLEEAWWDGASGWSRVGAAGPVRDEAAGTRLKAHAAYNFLRLLRDPATQAEWVVQRGAWIFPRMQLTPASHDPFEVEIIPASRQIVTNHFRDGTRSTERNYRPVGPIVWPMSFDVMQGRGFTNGEFSELHLLDEPALPAKP